jgi:hypothetical protein
LRTALPFEFLIAQLQQRFFSRVMAVIREQTNQIEKTDGMIQQYLGDNYKVTIESV